VCYRDWSSDVCSSDLAAVLVLSWAAAVCAAEDVDTERDPLECVNRKIFWFNDKLDVYVLAPVATGWEKVSPRRVRTSVSNFFGKERQSAVEGRGGTEG